MSAGKDWQGRIWEGRWEQLAHRVRALWWWAVAEEDLAETEGDYEQVVGLILVRTGEPRAAVEAKLAG
jgi:hypothetical protein